MGLRWEEEAVLVLDKVGDRRLNLCRPKDTSSLEGVLLIPAGDLVEPWIRLHGEYFTADGLVPFSDPPPLLADFLMIFILLRSLNPPGEEEGGREIRWVTDGEATKPPLAPLVLFSDVQWKADLRRAAVAPPVTAAEVF